MPDYHAIWPRGYGFVIHSTHWLERWRQQIWRWHLGWAIGNGWLWIAKAIQAESDTRYWVVWKRK